MNNNKNKSCLRYPGGKTRACFILTEMFDTYILPRIGIGAAAADGIGMVLLSPFFGGGSFEFHLQNKYGFKIIASDKFKPLITFWKVCKCAYIKPQLCEKLRESLGRIDKEHFHVLRKQIVNASDSDNDFGEIDINMANNYFIINRCSFSGATFSGGFSKESSQKRFTESSIERIELLNLDQFQFYNEDFEEFIQKQIQIHAHSGEKICIFLDPPYYLENGKSKLYGNNGDMHENFDHIRLHHLLLHDVPKNIIWMMTYNKCDFIETLYSSSSCKIIDVDWSYGMNKTKLSSEIVIIGGSE